MSLRSQAAMFALCLACFPAFYVCADDASVPAVVETPWLRAQGAGLYSSGQPTEAQFQSLRHEGVEVVIDLRADDETPDFDEAAYVRGLGLEYVALPVRGKQGLTRDNVMSLDALLAQAGGRPVLLHCASGNRVGAMMALREAWLRGATPEQALEAGRAWGMKSLESDVTELLRSGINTSVAVPPLPMREAGHLPPASAPKSRTDGIVPAACPGSTF